jgi:hypothetical protein
VLAERGEHGLERREVRRTVVDEQDAHRVAGVTPGLGPRWRRARRLR